MTSAPHLSGQTKFQFPFIRPSIPSVDEWTPFLAPAYATRRFSNFGPVNALFEARMAERFANGRAAVSVSSCTSGLVAALQALAVKGKVVIPSFTFGATANAVLQAGCQPIFCDCESENLHLASAALSQILARHDDVAGVIPVRALGLWASLDDIVDICRAKGVRVIVDAAPSLGAGDQPTSRDDLTEVFSLHATKTFGIGEGGIIFAPSDLEPALRQSTNFGLANGEVIADGTNAKLSEFHAAVGLAVLARIDDDIARRRQAASTYLNWLAGRDAVARMWNVNSASWNTFPVLLRQGLQATSVVELAQQRGVELRRYYLPLHQMRHYAGTPRGSLPITEDIGQRTICLPVYPDMSPLEQAEIIERLDKILT